MPDDDDKEAIGRPLARIAARHSPAELVDSDLSDAMQAGAGALGYAVKNLADEAAYNAENGAEQQWADQSEAGGQPAGVPG